MASFRARSGLKRQNRHLRRLFYVWRRLQSSVYLSWAPGDLNPADCFSRIDSDWKGDFKAAHQCALDRLTALQSYTGLSAGSSLDTGFPQGSVWGLSEFAEQCSGGSLTCRTGRMLEVVMHLAPWPVGCRAAGGSA